MLIFNCLHNILFTHFNGFNTFYFFISYFLDANVWLCLGTFLFLKWNFFFGFCFFVVNFLLLHSVHINGFKEM